MLNFTPSPSFDYSPVPQNPPLELVRSAMTAGVKTEIIDPVTQPPVIQLNPKLTLNERANLYITQYRNADGGVRLQLPPEQVVRVYEQASDRSHAVANLGIQAPSGDRLNAEIAASNTTAASTDDQTSTDRQTTSDSSGQTPAIDTSTTTTTTTATASTGSSSSVTLAV